MRRSRSIVGATLLVSIAVLAIAGFATYRSARALADASLELVRTKDVVLALERALSMVRDAETGQRGYLLTQQPAYLEPYTQSLTDIQDHLKRLVDVLAHDVDAERSLDRLNELIAVRIQKLDKGVALLNAGDAAGARDAVLSGEGKRWMDMIRALVAEMQAAQETKLAAQLREEETARTITIRTALATTLLAIAILGVLVYVVRRDSARIRDSEERLATTLRSIGDAVIATDEQGMITLMNPVAEALTGWRAGEARGKAMDAVFRIVNEQTRGVVDSPIARVLREGKIIGLANHSLLIRRDGVETPIEDSAAPILDARRTLVGVVLVFRDATRARAAERALRDADRRKDEFLAVLSHELRNPLAPVRQAVQIARAPQATEAQVRWSHEVIERQVSHMALLLDDLMDVSRITRGTLEVRRSRVELSSVIEAAIEMARPLIDSRRHELHLEIDAAPMVLDADPLRLAQVFGNLLTNAAKYTTIGGKIALHAQRQGETAIVRIIDNGIGLDADSLKQIFEMFAQVSSPLDRSESGLGIGLALAKGLVELHEGSIEARSPGPGRGSEFIVRLPLSSASAAPTSKGPSGPQRSQVGAGLHVLVADDNRDAAESLAMLLEMNGYVVRVAHDGNRAWEVLAETRPEIALLDIGMPNLNGYEVARRVRAESWGRDVTLIAITGWGQIEDREQARAAGFDHHLVKPVDPDAVLALCRGARAQDGHAVDA